MSMFWIIWRQRNSRSWICCTNSRVAIAGNVEIARADCFWFDAAVTCHLCGDVAVNWQREWSARTRWQVWTLACHYVRVSALPACR